MLRALLSAAPYPFAFALLALTAACGSDTFGTGADSLADAGGDLLLDGISDDRGPVDIGNDDPGGDDLADARDNPGGSDASRQDTRREVGDQDDAVGSDTVADAGGDDGGPALAEATMDIMPTCPSFTPCGAGADLIGSWVYSGGCIEESTFDVILDVCNGAALSNPAASVTGSVVITEATLTRDAAVSLNAEVDVDADNNGLLCDLPMATCGDIQTVLNTALGALGSVACGGAECNCDVTIDLNVDDSGGYTVSGTRLALSSSGRDYDFCVTGSRIAYRAVRTSLAEPGDYELSR